MKREEYRVIKFYNNCKCFHIIGHIRTYVCSQAVLFRIWSGTSSQPQSSSSTSVAAITAAVATTFRTISFEFTYAWLSLG